MATSQNDESVKYLHFRRIERGVVQARGGATVAYRTYGGSNVVEFAIAHCHEKDNFVKQQGRAKAGGRIRSERHRFAFFGSEKAFVSAVANNYAGRGLTRKFSRKTKKESVAERLKEFVG